MPRVLFACGKEGSGGLLCLTCLYRNESQSGNGRKTPRTDPVGCTKSAKAAFLKRHALLAGKGWDLLLWQQAAGVQRRSCKDGWGGEGGAVGARWTLRRDPTGGCLPREAPICQEIQAANQKVVVAASRGRRRVASEPAKEPVLGVLNADVQTPRIITVSCVR